MRDSPLDKVVSKLCHHPVLSSTLAQPELPKSTEGQAGLSVTSSLFQPEHLTSSFCALFLLLSLPCSVFVPSRVFTINYGSSLPQADTTHFVLLQCVKLLQIEEEIRDGTKICILRELLTFFKLSPGISYLLALFHPSLFSGRSTEQDESSE